MPSETQIKQVQYTKHGDDRNNMTVAYLCARIWFGLRLLLLLCGLHQDRRQLQQVLQHLACRHPVLTQPHTDMLAP